MGIKMRSELSKKLGSMKKIMNSIFYRNLFTKILVYLKEIQGFLAVSGEIVFKVTIKDYLRRVITYGKTKCGNIIFRHINSFNLN